MTVDSIDLPGCFCEQVAEDHVTPDVRRADNDRGRRPELPDPNFQGATNRPGSGAAVEGI
jgi:hypothetical protein